MSEIAITCAIGGAKHGIYPLGELWRCPCCERDVCADCHDDEMCADCRESAEITAEDKREQWRIR
jgi:hypothetical protein